MVQLVIASKAPVVSYGVLAVAKQIEADKPGAVEVVLREETSVKTKCGADVAAFVEYEGKTYCSTNAIARLLARLYPETNLYGCPISSTLIDRWIDFGDERIAKADAKSLDAAFKVLNKRLTLRSYIVGYNLTIADLAIWGTLKSSKVFANKIKKQKAQVGEYLVRWYEYISSFKATQDAVSAQQNKATKAKVADQGKFEIGLTDAHMGNVVTRFPPEPSGYLHIGHAKAALLNQYFAQTYKGRMIVRFDDTNPSKEKSEYEDSIREDLALIGVDSTIVTHTSDYFDKLYDLALKMIKEGNAYVDNTDQTTMRDERKERLPSKCRDQPVEENLRRFEEMKNGTEFGQTCCLRAKIQFDSVNGTLRDPVIYRCNLTPHHYTGDKWKIYPTYDFACPIVDSLEKVTHALRTNEYRDRNPQYQWMLETLGLEKVTIWDFSRINFVYTLLSKRKLQWFVDQGIVSGWDDPRFPTVRGIRRRGMTIEALKQYILMQGASQSTTSLEWDKLWALNKKEIDPVSPRHVAILKDNVVKCNVQGAPATPEVKDMPKHKKNESVGTKKTTFSNVIVLEQEDAQSMEVGEEVTLMDWGNAFVRNVQKTGEQVTSIDFELHLEGDFKTTKKKLTWLSHGDELVDVVLVDYDYLITKKKLEEGDNVEDFVTAESVFKENAVADANVANLQKGDIIQFERKGYYILDQPATDTLPANFISIPDGKTASTVSKASKASK